MSWQRTAGILLAAATLLVGCRESGRELLSPVIIRDPGRGFSLELFAGEEVVAKEVARICAEADAAIAAGTATGHIFNLGHGVLPHTAPEAITRAVEIIHEH